VSDFEWFPLEKKKARQKEGKRARIECKSCSALERVRTALMKAPNRTRDEQLMLQIMHSNPKNYHLFALTFVVKQTGA
jgi:hypothetical protein